MCLSSLHPIVLPSDNTGYKVFAKHYSNRLYGVWFNFHKDIPTGFKFNTEYRAVKETALTSKPPTSAYQTGFHIFTSEESAFQYATQQRHIVFDKMVVVKVRYNGVLATGIELLCNRKELPCLVAEKMTLLEEIRDPDYWE